MWVEYHLVIEWLGTVLWAMQSMHSRWNKGGKVLALVHSCPFWEYLLRKISNQIPPETLCLHFCQLFINLGVLTPIIYWRSQFQFQMLLFALTQHIEKCCLHSALCSVSNLWYKNSVRHQAGSDTVVDRSHIYYVVLSPISFFWANFLHLLCRMVFLQHIGK